MLPTTLAQLPSPANPLWMLLPWAVFAVAAGIQFWRITRVFRQHRLSSRDIEQVRSSLERLWSRDRQRP